MTKNESNSEKVMIKCPNPDCGLILHSKYHTICPRCAQPFPIDMLHIEKSSSQISAIIVIIIMFILVATVTALIIF